MAAGIKLTREEYVKAAEAVHGDRYDYTDIVYKNIKSYVDIACKLHGKFTQRASNHLEGRGCRICGGSSNLNTDEFTRRCAILHDGTYNYSLVKYVNNSAKVKIICGVHGEFDQVAASHMAGNGCPKCDGRFGRDTEEFIRKSKLVHGDLYGYSETVYTTTHTPVRIICKLHGGFKKSPAHHLLGSGCQSCVSYGFNKYKQATIYVLVTKNYCGFGITNNIKSRLSTHRRNLKKYGLVFEVVKLWHVSGEKAVAIESNLKQNLNIVSMGVEGFKTESVLVKDAGTVVQTIEDFLTNEGEVNGIQ